MEHATRVSVHVAAWNARAYLADLVTSLDAQDVREVQALLVGDTPAPDRLGAVMDVMTLRQFNQAGPVRAHNQALAFTAARLPADDLANRLIVIAHPDIVFEEKAIGAMLAAFDADPTLMIGVPVLRQARFSLAEDIELRDVERLEAIDHIGVSCSRGRVLRENRMADARKVFAPSEACAVFRASALLELGEPGAILDEAFEERQAIVDATWRIRARGGKLAVLEDVVAWHHGHDGWNGGSKLFRYWSAEARARRASMRTGMLCFKHDFVVNRLVHAPWIFGQAVKRFFAHVVDPKGFFAGFSALGNGGTLLRARGRIAKERTVRPAEMRGWFE